MSKELICMGDACKVTKEPVFKETADGTKEVFFFVKAQDGMVYYCIAFHEENYSKSPYQRIKNMGLTKGKYVNITASLHMNVTKSEDGVVTSSPILKIKEIDYTIPEEMYRDMKEKKEKIIPLRLGGDE